MTDKEAIVFLNNMIAEKSASTIGKEGFYVELMEYHVQALKIAIRALEFKEIFSEAMAKEVLAVKPIPAEDKQSIMELLRNPMPVIPFNDVVAINIQEDIDKPNAVQTKDGKWHENAYVSGFSVGGEDNDG